MRKSLWIILTAVLVAICAPTARADSFTYSFVGTGYFAGTDVSFTTNGPAVLDSLYSPNPGATDLFVLGADKGRFSLWSGKQAYSFLERPLSRCHPSRPSIQPTGAHQGAGMRRVPQ
jgi:hypothetical protein